MTRRRSRREIADAVDDLGGDPEPQTVREWVDEYLGHGLKDVLRAEYTIYDSDGEIVEEPDHSGEVCIWRASADVGTKIWTDETEVPDWIDADEDLPVIE